jgi:hypothetical protein
MEQGPRRGPEGLGERHYARVARDYVRAVEQGKKDPLAAVARLKRWHGATPKNVRDWVHRARRHGLLTAPPRPGQPGGQLTDKALAALERGKD